MVGPPLGSVCAEVVCGTLLLFPTLQKWQLVFWRGFSSSFLFFFLYLVVQNLPNCTSMQLFFVPYSFFLFCCLRRCLSRCKHCCKRPYVPGPRLSPNGQGVHKGSRLSLTKRVALDEGTWRTHGVCYAQVSTTLVSYLNFLNLVFLVCHIVLIIAPISSIFVHNKCQRDTNTADSTGLWWESTGII